jgi:hypothetical protein
MEHVDTSGAVQRWGNSIPLICNNVEAERAMKLCRVFGRGKMPACGLSRLSARFG